MVGSPTKVTMALIVNKPNDDVLLNELSQEYRQEYRIKASEPESEPKEFKQTITYIKGKSKKSSISNIV